MGWGDLNSVLGEGVLGISDPWGVFKDSALRHSCRGTTIFKPQTVTNKVSTRNWVLATSIWNNGNKYCVVLEVLPSLAERGCTNQNKEIEGFYIEQIHRPVRAV